MRLRVCRAVAGLGRSRASLVSVEFALLAPFVAVAGLSTMDIARGFLAWQRASAAAAAVAEIATAQAATPSDTNQLQVTDVQTAASAVIPYFPDVATGTPYGVTVTSLVFETAPSPCATNCTTPHVAWSGQFAGSLGTAWTCDGAPGAANANAPLTVAADGSPAAANVVPASDVSAQPILAVLVYYQFTPIYLTSLLPNITFVRSAYLAPRIGNNQAWIQLLNPGASPYRCPDYNVP